MNRTSLASWVAAWVRAGGGIVAWLAAACIVSGAGHIMAAEPAKDTDPFQWLEDVTGEKALAWVKQRNDESTGELTKSDAFQRLNDRLLQILDSDARIPMVQKHGDFYYNFWRDAAHRRGLWRRTTLDEYRKADPKWDVIIDLDQLAEAENENWVWHAAAHLKANPRRCLISLSRGGADADVTREYDLEKREFVKNGFYLPEAKSRVSWRDENSLFIATDFGEGSLTTSGYPRVVKQWDRGTPLEKATTVFEGRAEDVSVTGFHDQTPGFERDFLERAITFWTNELFVRREGQLVKIDKPDDAEASVHRELLLFTLRSDWEVGGRKYLAGSLLAADFDGFLAGRRELSVLFEPSARKSLAGFTPTRHHILVNELDNVRNRVYTLTQSGAKWNRVALPGAPGFGTISVGAVDADESDDYFLTVADYVTPTTLSLGRVGVEKTESLKALPAFFEAKGLAIRQHEAASKDGTKVPYFEVSKSELKLDGKNTTLLYGYGGFEISMLPSYNPVVGTAWLENGGVYVVANIRGGGEFGPQWHQAALKENRHKAYEDFIAVAEDLVRRKVTSPERLGTMGGSNGGLLMGNMLTRRPDLFGAIVCQVPLLDMQRYTKLLAGASWMGEYGDPDDPAQWEFIQTFSPYHRVASDAKYPRTLFTTSTRDDRVHPGHARKMVAKMKEMGHDVVYYENMEGGHAGAANNRQQAFMSALAYTFLWKQLRN